MIIDEDVDEYGNDFYSGSAYKMKDIIFDIMLSGVISFPGIAMELNRQKHYGKEWRGGGCQKIACCRDD